MPCCSGIIAPACCDWRSGCSSGRKARAEKSRKLASILHTILPLPIELWDERSSTVSAANILSDNGTYGKKRKEVLDAVAATVILESYMAFRANQKKQQN